MSCFAVWPGRPGRDVGPAEEAAEDEVGRMSAPACDEDSVLVPAKVIKAGRRGRPSSLWIEKHRNRGKGRKP
jgi:hypothetical protein